MRTKFIIFVIFFISINLYGFEQTGMASWYGPDFHGKKTANGEIFNTTDFTAAHRTLPFGSIVKVTSLENKKTTIVRINDRGPFAKNRVIDLSKSAAEELEMIKYGIIKVKIELLELGEDEYHRFSNKKYMLQLASFTDEENALKYIEKYSDNNLKMQIKKIKSDKLYYRIIIDNINYYELQEYKIKLHRKNIEKYIVTKK